MSCIKIRYNKVLFELKHILVWIGVYLKVRARKIMKCEVMDRISF